MKLPTEIKISITAPTLTESELKSAYILSHYQKLGISRLMTEIANEKISMKYNGADPVAYAQREAELAGQLVILQHLLDLSSAYEVQVEEELKAAAERNNSPQ